MEEGQDPWLVPSDCALGEDDKLEIPAFLRKVESDAQKICGIDIVEDTTPSWPPRPSDEEISAKLRRASIKLETSSICGTSHISAPQPYGPDVIDFYTGKPLAYIHQHAGRE